MEIIKPFSFISDDSEKELKSKEFELEKAKFLESFNGKTQEKMINISVDTAEIPKIVNSYEKKNTFKDFCKSACKFIKDSVSINLYGAPFNLKFKNMGVIINPKKINNMINGKIVIGPAEIKLFDK